MFVGGVGSVDSFEQGLLFSEREKAKLCARQVEAIRHLDQAQVDLVDGARSMVEWVASRLDVSHQQARDLVFLAKANNAEVEQLLSIGEIGLDRAVAMARLRLAGASGDVMSQSFGYDLPVLPDSPPPSAVFPAPTKPQAFNPATWSSNAAWMNQP